MPKDLMVLLRPGGRHDLLNWLVWLHPFLRNLLLPHFAKPSLRTSSSTIGTSKPGIIDSGKSSWSPSIRRIQNKIFDVVRKEPKGGVNYLEKTSYVTILNNHDETSQVHIDIDHDLTLPACLKLGDQVIPICEQDGQVITLEGEWLLQEGREGEIVEHATLTPQIQQQLIDFWKPRWWKDTLPQPTEWTRIVNFAKAYLPFWLLGSC